MGGMCVGILVLWSSGQTSAYSLQHSPLSSLSVSVFLSLFLSLHTGLLMGMVGTVSVVLLVGFICSLRGGEANLLNSLTLRSHRHHRYCQRNWSYLTISQIFETSQELGQSKLSNVKFVYWCVEEVIFYNDLIWMRSFAPGETLPFVPHLLTATQNGMSNVKNQCCLK